jgi:hypothetical protein
MIFNVSFIIFSFPTSLERLESLPAPPECVPSVIIYAKCHQCQWEDFVAADTNRFVNFDIKNSVRGRCPKCSRNKSLYIQFLPHENYVVQFFSFTYRLDMMDILMLYDYS